MSEAGRAATRRRYAEMMTGSLPHANPRLRDAFAAVPREDFAGPPPWTVLGAGFRPLRARDPADLYQDVLIQLDPAKLINNGSPSLHAAMLHALAVQPGDRVLHVGTGGGYYTALLAELTGAGGEVTGVEYDARLAAQARDNLARWPWVRAVQGDGAAFPATTVQRIYVNFALADPAAAWLDQLAVGGRLICPLGVPDRKPQGQPRSSARAEMLVVTRTAEGYAARFAGSVGFVFAEGALAGDAATHAALLAAFELGGMDTVRSLRRGPAPDGWVSTPHWSLCTEAA